MIISSSEGVVVRLYQPMAQTYQNAPRGEARREAILQATLDVIAAHGTDGVTHRAVAAAAGVPLSATTYWFTSRDDLLENALRFAAHGEIERLERLVFELASQELTAAEWARALAAALAGQLDAYRERQLALFELALESARHPALRPEAQQVRATHLRLAEMGARAAGSDDPRADAPIIVATVAGLMFDQLAAPVRDFEGDLLRPALERLFERLVAGVQQPA
jgi:TetR/AcrR family transcriptional regulator, regulator of biofilm formation and stress response